jgi:hypothetical protein
MSSRSRSAAGNHREVHRSGDEAAWWTTAAIDPTVPARALWLKTHPLPTISDKPRVEDPTASRPTNREPIEKAATTQ